MRKPSSGERALEIALDEEREKDSLFDEKCAYWQGLMDDLLRGRVPMLMAETKQGQAKLDVINEKVSAAMIAKYGE
jgi:hypothetical protein